MKKKLLIIVLVLLMLITSFFVLTKKPKIKYKKLKELNYNVTYKEAFPDENLRRGVLLCIMRNKCDATQANNSLYEYSNYKGYWGNAYFRENYWSTKAYSTSSYGTVITNQEIESKENEIISKVDLDKLQILLANDYEKDVNLLQGIEYLPNLKIILISQIKQKNIDLSYNKELKNLYLEYQIDKINLEENLKLKEIIFRISKESKNLNFSHLTNLEIIDSGHSEIENIILPSSIKKIKLEWNKISSITLPNGIEDVNLNGNKIKNIVIPSSVKKLNLENSDITDITLPEGIEKVNLRYNNLSNLNVPSSVKYLSATNNKISNIELPNGIIGVYLDDNKIKNIVIPSSVKGISLENNNITDIDLPEGVENVYLSKNKLTSLVIPSSVKKLYAGENNISNDIVVPEGVKELNLGKNKISNIVLPSSLIGDVILSENNISNIDLSNLANVESLNLNNNPLHSIDVRNMLKLKRLYLRDTKFKNDIDLKSNVNLEGFYISGVEDGEEPRVENFDFSKNLNLKSLEIGNRNLKNFDIKKCINFRYIGLINNIMDPNLDLSEFTNLTSITLLYNKLTNVKLPDKYITDDYNGYELNANEYKKLKVKKNSYVTIPKNYINNKEITLRDYPYAGIDDKSYFTRNGETYVFHKVGTGIYYAIGIPISSYSTHHFIWRYDIEVEAGEEHTFNPVFDQGNYTPLINEEIPVNKLKEMITNLPANIKNFEILSSNTFTEKGDKTIKVRITFSDDTFKEVDIPIKVYEKEDILPTVSVTPSTLEVIEKKPVNINITRSYAKEDNIDNTNFIKTVRDNLVSYEYLNKANGLTYNSNSVTGVIDYLFTGTEEEHTFNITYKEKGKIYTFNKNISIKLLRDTDKDGTPDKDDDDKDGDGFSNAVEIARGSDPYDKTSLPDMSKKDELDNLIKQLEKLIEDTKNNPFDSKNKLDVDNLKNNYLPAKVTEKDNIKSSYDNTTSDTELIKLKEKVKEIIDDIKKEINKLRDKANFEELDKEINKEVDNSYIDIDIKPLIDKIKEAKDLDRNTATQEEVDKITKEIKDLREKIIIDKTKLKEKIKELEKAISDNICKSEACKTLLNESKSLYDKTLISKKEMFDMIDKIDDVLKNNMNNPNTGIKTYSLIILFIILISYIVFKKHKNYIR